MLYPIFPAGIGKHKIEHKKENRQILFNSIEIHLNHFAKPLFNSCKITSIWVDTK
jgi:hypothetical protein